MGEENQNVWATCLTQCSSVLYKILLETLHSSAFKKNLQKIKNLELGLLLKNLLIRN
jgi:hypothetical protein